MNVGLLQNHSTMFSQPQKILFLGHHSTSIFNHIGNVSIMYKSSQLLLLVLFSTTVQIVQSIINKNPSYTVFPLIVIKTDKGLEAPTDINYSANSKPSENMRFLRSQFKKEVFFCPSTAKRKRDEIENTEKVPKGTKGISEHCLAALSSITRAIKTDIPRCNKEPEPIILRVLPESTTTQTTPENQNSQDPTQNPIQQFKFGYQQLSRFKDILNFEVYSFWYNTQKKTVLYTKHTIKSAHLLFNERLQNEQKVEYVDDTSAYGIFGEDFTKAKQALHKTHENNAFKMQKLIPADDFALALWRKPTFHYININLMHEQLQPVWNKFHDIIRNDSKWLTGKYDIYTGVFDLPRMSSASFKSRLNFQLPQIWVKIVHRDYGETLLENPTKKEDFKREAIAIIANNHLSDYLAQTIKDHLCKEPLYDDYFATSYPDIHKYISCCKVTTNILQLFNLSLQFEKVLSINQFETSSK